MEESEDERCFDEMNESVPPIELPPCELARLEEISGQSSITKPSFILNPFRSVSLIQIIEADHLLLHFHFYFKKIPLNKLEKR